MDKHLMVQGYTVRNYNIDEAFRTPPSIGNYKTAFTLAEVLITLGIIGIVAAMTMPALINKTQDKVLETQRKKAENSLANGYKRILALNEVFKTDETKMFSIECLEDILFCFSKENKKAFNIIRDSSYTADKDAIVAAMPNEYAKSKMKWDDMFYIFQTVDGYTYGLNLDRNEFEKGNYNVSIYADVNSSKNPNTYGNDLVTYLLTPNGRISDTTNYGGEDPYQGCSLDNAESCSMDACYALQSSFFEGTECRYAEYDYDAGRCEIITSYCE